MRLTSPDCGSVRVNRQRRSDNSNQPAEIPVGDALVVREILGPTGGLRALELIGS